MDLHLNLFERCTKNEAALLAVLAGGEYLSKATGLRIGALAGPLGLVMWGPTAEKATVAFVGLAAQGLEDKGLVAIHRSGEVHNWVVWLTPPSTSWLSEVEWSILAALRDADRRVTLDRLVEEVCAIGPGAMGYEGIRDSMAELVEGLAGKPMPVRVRYMDSADTGFTVWLEE